MLPEVEGKIHGWILDDVVLPSARVRQGDLIKFEEATDVLRKLAIVVTADCDLEQKKHGRTLTLVPIVTAVTIIENYLIPDDCEKKRELIERFTFSGLSIDTDQDEISKYAYLKQASEDNWSEISNSLKTAVNFLLKKTDSMRLQDYNSLMADMKMSPRKIGSLKDQLRSRGDLLILPNAEALGIRGHIAWVRQLWQISASEIAIRTSEIPTRTGERVARLDSPFRYRLTQLIAQVFSDIGLPGFSDSIDEVLKETYR